MLLTLFYMISTWVQAWKLSSLKARLTVALNLGLDTARPSIMFHIKPQDFVKDDIMNKNPSDGNEDLLSSHLCSNKSIAKLGDLLWCQGDKRLCIIYPLQKIDVSDWLLYQSGQTNFPLYMNSVGQPSLFDDTKMHVLIEADVCHYHPYAVAKATQLEHYGRVLTWTVNKVFATVIETDIDHLTKLAIALMQGQCFINNGLLLTRIESISITGKPCCYNIEKTSFLHEKRLVGKAQWEAHIKRLQLFSSTARNVVQHGKPFEVENSPGIIVFPGNRSLSLQMPTVLTIEAPEDGSVTDDGNHVPKAPPPTPASTSIENQFSTTNFDNAQSVLLNEIGPPSNSINHPKIESPIKQSDNASHSAKPPNTDISTPQKPPRKQFSTNTAKSSPAKGNKIEAFDVSIKPPNVLIYADSTVARENIKKVLQQTLNKERYTIYTLSPEEARKDVWIEQANLVVICGNVDGETASQLIEYIVKGGKVLTLCSDALNHLLPSFKTAEVREHELVRFSYGRWKSVQMMHHIFCYQASPMKSRFSQDQEDSRAVPPQTPVSANVRDKSGKTHIFQVRVLGTEETWQTPSIVLATLPNIGGKVVFSQIHLEADPSQYEFEEAKFNALKASDSARLEILSDLLSSHLAMDVGTKANVETVFKPGFFLGRHELKLEMLDRLKEKMLSNDILEMSKMQLQFCSASTKVMTASSSILPIMLHQCPDDFSTLEYFENLKTKEIGRLVVYAQIMTSSMNVVNGCKLHHGLVVIPRQQTQGQGRSGNVWLSPEGCAMFTMQLHIRPDSYLGRHLPILQHLVSVAVVSAIKSIPEYENIDLRVKWPNDIYIGSQTKVGGMIVTTLIEASNAICNIGVGVNLSNSQPTCSINDVIKKYNEKNRTNLSCLSYERYFALVFTELENIIDIVQSENIEYFHSLYYEYWIHTDAEVSVMSESGDKQDVKILGIDDFGFLKVQGKNGKIFTVQPDGNSFDITKGLIAPSMTR